MAKAANIPLPERSKALAEDFDVLGVDVAPLVVPVAVPLAVPLAPVEVPLVASAAAMKAVMVFPVEGGLMANTIPA